MITSDAIGSVTGADLRDGDDDRVGKVGQVYIDGVTGEPAWVTVSTGLFGRHESFVPLAEATWDGDAVRVPYGKDLVKGAPTVDPEGQGLTPAEEAELYAYYGVEYAAEDAPEGVEHAADEASVRVDYADDEAAQGVAYAEDAPTAGTEVADAEGTQFGDTDDAMTRSEERLNVTTERQETGRVRLRKYIVTEMQTVTVPVTREEIRLEHEPITAENQGEAVAGAPLTEAEHEVVLHEERVVVTTETVPVERVRLATDTVTEMETVSGEVRKERIEVDGAVDTDAAADVADLETDGRSS